MTIPDMTESERAIEGLGAGAGNGFSAEGLVQSTVYETFPVFASHVPAVLARAWNERLQDFSEREIARVYDPCANPILCRVIIKRCGNSGFSLAELYKSILGKTADEILEHANEAICTCDRAELRCAIHDTAFMDGEI